MQLAESPEKITAAAVEFEPCLVICPFLKDRVPAEVWRQYRTIIIHPGPPGDRGPSSLDWAITEAETSWGVTALQAVEEMDAGPIWGYRTFPLPADPPRKSSLYNGAVTQAAIELVHEVVTKAADRAFRPRELNYSDPDIRGKLRPLMHQSDRAFSWTDPTSTIVRRIRAADGSPGVRAIINGTAVSVFDAHPGPALSGTPGALLQRSRGAALVRTGDGSVWIGHVRVRDRNQPKLPATMALGSQLGQLPEVTDPVGYQEISYFRTGPVGVLSFDFYNGAMSTGQCERLAAAVRQAAAQDTRVLIIRGGEIFSNGIHLNVIEAAPSPSIEAWQNIKAIDDVCREIITCTRQLVMTSVGGNAGAGGVMLALGADEVLAHEGVVLNPHYRTMGLYGSEYWTYVLPRRVGSYQAELLTTCCEPIDVTYALQIGLVDQVVDGPRSAFEDVVLDHALRIATRDDYHLLLERKRSQRAEDERRRPLDVYRTEELATMSRDIFDDRLGFAAARHAFVMKRPLGSQTVAQPAETRLHVA
ncbi:MAG TPA: enoyl-CoA hydratase-related protein [Pseudonocardia sp.]|nr:enoyl-CoA hydratase-related protein [Pseudonocardia sp.]